MRSKLMATFMAGATLCAFTFIASATPAEAQACNNNNNASWNSNRFRKFKQNKRRHLRRAVRNGNLPFNNYPYYGTQPVSVNPYYAPANSVYGNVLNPYYNTGGIMNTLRNLF